MDMDNGFKVVNVNLDTDIVFTTLITKPPPPHALSPSCVLAIDPVLIFIQNEPPTLSLYVYIYF